MMYNTKIPTSTCVFTITPRIEHVDTGYRCVCYVYVGNPSSTLANALYETILMKTNSAYPQAE